MPTVEPNPDNFAVNPLSPADLDALSAYLDGALSPAGRAALEARLAAEPELRAELAAIQQVVSALHSLPDLRAPRDFRVTRADIQPARRILPFPAFASGLSAVAAALLLIAGITMLRPVSLSAPAAEGMEVAALPTQTGAAAPEATDLARSLRTDEFAVESAAPLEAEATTGVTLGIVLDETASDAASNAAGAGMAAPDTAAAGITDAAVQPPAAAELAAPALPEYYEYEATGEVRPEESQMAQSAPVLEATRTKEGTPAPGEGLTSIAAQPTASLAPQATLSAPPAVTATEVPADDTSQAQVRGSSVPLAGVVLIGGGLVLGLAAVLFWRRARG